MEGHPGHFESISNRLGFQVEEEGPERLRLAWHGTRFPGFLCLMIALALLFLSVPVMEAIRLRGFGGTAGSLWFFPALDLILMAVAVFLLSVRRTILIDQRKHQVRLSRASLLRRRDLTVAFSEIGALRLGTDMVYGGFAVAGSTMGQTFFPAFSLRLTLTSGKTVLLDRGGKRQIRALADRLSRLMGKPIAAAEGELQA